MTPGALLIDSFERISEGIPRLLDGLRPDDLAHRVAPDANTIGWLVWHLLRVQDDHVSEVAGTEQIWTAHGFDERFALPFPTSATGYGHTSTEVGQVRATVDLLSAYAEAVHTATTAFLETVTESDLDRIVDTSWTPAVTLGARLVSVINDDTQHLGQAALLRGLLRAP